MPPFESDISVPTSGGGTGGSVDLSGITSRLDIHEFRLDQSAVKTDAISPIVTYAPVDIDLVFTVYTPAFGSTSAQILARPYTTGSINAGRNDVRATIRTSYDMSILSQYVLRDVPTDPSSAAADTIISLSSFTFHDGDQGDQRFYSLANEDGTRRTLSSNINRTYSLAKIVDVVEWQGSIRDGLVEEVALAEAVKTKLNAEVSGGQDSTFIYGVNGLVDSEEATHTTLEFMGRTISNSDSLPFQIVPFDIGQEPLRSHGPVSNPITFYGTATHADPTYAAPAGKGLYFVLENGVYTISFVCRIKVNTNLDGVAIRLTRVSTGTDDIELETAVGGYVSTSDGVTRRATAARLTKRILPVTTGDIFYVSMAATKLSATNIFIAGSLDILRHN